MAKYEITVELPNGDWVWTIGTFKDVHDMMECALAYANGHGARVHHVERLADPTSITTVVD